MDAKLLTLAADAVKRRGEVVRMPDAGPELAGTCGRQGGHTVGRTAQGRAGQGRAPWWPRIGLLGPNQLELAISFQCLKGREVERSGGGGDGRHGSTYLDFPERKGLRRRERRERSLLRSKY